MNEPHYFRFGHVRRRRPPPIAGLAFMGGFILGFSLMATATWNATVPDPAYIVDMTVHFHPSWKQDLETLTDLLIKLGDWQKTPRPVERERFSRVRMALTNSPLHSPVTLYKRGSHMLHPDSFDHPYCQQWDYEYQCVNCRSQPRPDQTQPPAPRTVVRTATTTGQPARAKSVATSSAAGSDNLDILSNGGSQWTDSPVPWAAPRTEENRR